jgi:RNA polymerase sigma-70 factor (ECF subfamily)
MNRLRGDRRHDDIADHPELAVTPEDPLEAGDARRLMRQAMTKLTLAQREILGLILLPEMNYPEIAGLLDIPLNTVKTRVFYAKEALREQLLGMGVTAYDI